jgi:hypothetical protein
MEDNNNKKLKKIEKELNKASKLHKAQSAALGKASKMHKSQADRISKMTNEDDAMKKSKKGMAMYGKKMTKESLEELTGLFEKLCAKGKAYRRKRMAAGEKSSAYLSGRAVKVCKGQMKGEGIEENLDESDMSIQEVLDMEVIDENITEAKYKGKTVTLNKPMRGDSKKFKVYVNSGKKNADGSIKVKKVNFGHGGTSAKRPTMRIRKSDPKRRKAFRARHRCDNPGPKTMARYWSCKKW